MDATSSGDALVMPPIPLASGTVVVDDDGLEVAIAAITVLVETVDGREERIGLVQRNGAWWAPPD
ncbi:hypothetical protein GB931_11945 [Modestobacter sp. I12A-02628]|uniref:Uncharacterized protein n=1 Tax=Goekera deserti TaxID=2497753 RepID=A0A7K3WE54_9ACTN|nr:hypothetical protein [Goekera deserti]MPQ98618.1 hypothetical protein [Goekera deserti]NDI49010.1 hypothetical protein [Goekera deserti]NEL54199.1 hypothetical protein [Goekera deserti]